MEIEVSSSTPDDSVNRVELDSIRVKRKTLQNLLEDCQRALELLNLAETGPGGDGIEASGSQEEDNSDSPEREEEFSSSSDQGDPETDKLYDLIKSRVEGHDFREKIELAQVSLLQDLPEDGSTWDVVSEDDVWGEGETEDDYVLVREEDIADGIACFMATYLSSLKQTKELSKGAGKGLGPMLVNEEVINPFGDWVIILIVAPRERKTLRMRFKEVSFLDS
ncbi:hypothetical protein F2Q68_00037395 [Brassica cretica]|uniref:Uncharacterized protein n=1 Tax=Brassica cretica TaxID=69181 RepID=A0A8S9H6G3_BRACR|nr:hypothetical protein F2Q68_00037395 [Brassica cretica]